MVSLVAVKFRNTLCRASAIVLCGCLAFSIDASILYAQPFAGVPATGIPATGLQAAVALESALVDAIAKAEKSVVAIARIDESATRADRTGRDDVRLPAHTRTPADSNFVPDHFGTGVVIDRRGLILTQFHVVGKQGKHFVTTVDGKSYDARVMAADPRSDLAVLKIDANDLTPIKFGDASSLKKGQIVISLGNPYAIARDGQASASWGIISNLSRKAVPNPSDSSSTGKEKLYHFGTLIQTDAKLNLGTSGGALINLKGEMIGLTTSMAATAGFEQAAGYALPVDDVFRRAVDALKEGREVEYGFLGVWPANLTDKEIGIGLRGVRVEHVVAGLPAELFGVMRNDLVTHVNEQPIVDADSFMLHVGKQSVESSVRLKILRERQGQNPLEQTINVELTKFPVRGTKIVTSQPPAWRGIRVDYPTAMLDKVQQIRRTDLLRDGCVVITEVEKDSPAWKAELQPGMFIASVGTSKIRNPKEFRNAVLGKEGAIELQVFGGADLSRGPEPRVVNPTAN